MSTTMLDSLRDSIEMFRDQVWFFRFFLMIGAICIYRVLLQYVFKTNQCPNPFCSKCLGSGTVRGRAMNRLKIRDEDNNDDNPLTSIIHNNLLQYERLCRKSDEKPTVYFHRGLSSEIKLTDKQLLIDHYDELRQEIVKFLQENDNIQWTNFYLYKNGIENENNCERLPKLFEILHLLPNVICINNRNCLFGNCFLTRLTADNNEENENQNGFTNCCIRLHFGLICDEPSSIYVRINKQKRLPIENKHVTLYNDAIQHSIQNPNEKQQIFLTIDFWHSDLLPDMREQLTAIFHTDIA